MKYFLLSLVISLGIEFPNIAQKFPELEEAERIKRLEPHSGIVDAVLDTDTYNEIDDQFALVYALLSNNKINLRAVYAAPYFNDRSTGPADGMEKSYQEILRIIEFMGKPSAGFAFKGSEGFLKDGVTPYRSPAALDLVKKANETSVDNPLYVITIGAITNVASAILIDPAIIDKIVVVWLGGNGHSWPDTREFNFAQDLHASRTIFDCGVPLVQVPCTPVVTHFTTTVPEMERYAGGRGKTGEYLLKIFREYNKGEEKAWSKVLWDMTAVAWVVNAQWTPSQIVHSPIVTDQYTYSFSNSRHLIRYVYFINRDAIFRDFFNKLDSYAK
jgi:inosine-uridine nucleoside N-ribohydrolase